MVQTAVGNGPSLDPFSFCRDGGAAPEVDVDRGEIVDALVVAPVVVVVDKSRDLDTASTTRARPASETLTVSDRSPGERNRQAGPVRSFTDPSLFVPINNLWWPC